MTVYVSTKCFVLTILVKTKILLVGFERNFVEEEPLCGSTEKHLFPTKGKVVLIKANSVAHSE